MCYMTYNLTNHSVMKIWSWKLTLVDKSSGTFAAALSSYFGFFVTMLAIG